MKMDIGPENERTVVYPATDVDTDMDNAKKLIFNEVPNSTALVQWRRDRDARLPF